ncbi:MAG TPA: response regulator transcription factor [Streptosporangiaceae bacterium]
MVIRVVLAEDNYLLREGTAALLSAVPEVDLVASADDLDSLLAAVSEFRPDVVITDIRMPPDHAVEGLNAAQQIRADYPGTGIILLTQFAEPEYAYQLLRRGATGVGYLLKDHIADIEELTRALSQVAAGGTALDPQLVEALVIRRERQGDTSVGALSPRERQVLEQMAQGKSNTAIGRALFLTERAVQKHINSVFHKLGLSESPELDRRVAAVLRFLDARGTDSPGNRGLPG